FGETEREVMEIEYSGGGKLLMPMENLNLIQKYSGGADSQPKLDRLGGTTWARTKASVKKAMRDMADELLKLYATRQLVQGHARPDHHPGLPALSNLPAALRLLSSDHRAPHALLLCQGAKGDRSQARNRRDRRGHRHASHPVKGHRIQRPRPAGHR